MRTCVLVPLTPIPVTDRPLIMDMYLHVHTESVTQHIMWKQIVRHAHVGMFK